jgi:hypothetical protein
VKIYLSATYRDLHRYRLAVSMVLRRMGHQVIGMEDYVAEDIRPLGRCLEDVGACDVYIGLLAWRYGYVPTDPRSAPVPLPVGTSFGTTSITEFEFRRAVAGAGSPAVLMFLLDPEADWPSNQLDAMSATGDGGKAIAALRDEVTQQYLTSYFRSPEELASLVSAAVYRVEMGRQMTLESLRVEPRFNQDFIRNGPVVDSTVLEIKNVIAGPAPIDALEINLGQGFDWWMTRLYFLSSLAADLTPIEIIVFVSEGRSFVGAVHPRIVKEQLEQRYPMLREYADSNAAAVRAGDLGSEVDRRAMTWTQHMTSKLGAEGTAPVMVTRRELEGWLKPYLVTEAIDWDPGSNAAIRMQRLLDWPMRFVPVLENGQFTRVVDKQKLTEQVARLFVREQVSRALSTMR